MVELESNSLHTEKSDSEARAKEIQESPLKLDAHGIPLLPQPSDRKDDPLVGSVLPDVKQPAAVASRIVPEDKSTDT
jgi:hypothetical protein